jgi:hypothetical protein
MAIKAGPNLVRSGLALYLDAGAAASYSGSGTAWNDLSGNNNHFTLYNSPTYNSSFGGELRFDGTNDYARNRNNTIINNIASFGTVEIWYRTYDGVLGGLNYSRLISVANDAGTGSDSTSTQGTNNDFSTFFCLARNNGTNYYNIWYKSNPGPFGGTTTYNDNIYRQIVMSWSYNPFTPSMTFTHYINAVSQVSTTYNGQTPYSGANNITIGMNCLGAISNTGTETNKGAYSIVRLYSKTLSQAEITQNYNATKSRFNLI